MQRESLHEKTATRGSLRLSRICACARKRIRNQDPLWKAGCWVFVLENFRRGRNAAFLCRGSPHSLPAAGGLPLGQHRRAADQHRLRDDLQLRHDRPLLGAFERGWLRPDRRAALRLAGAVDGNDCTDLWLVRSDAHHSFGRGRLGPEQALRFLLVLVQPRNRTQLLLPAVSRVADLPGGYAAVSIRRAARSALLADFPLEPRSRNNDRYCLSYPLQHRGLLDSRGARVGNACNRDRAHLHRQLCAVAVLPRLAARHCRLAALQWLDERARPGL